MFCLFFGWLVDDEAKKKNNNKQKTKGKGKGKGNWCGSSNTAEGSLVVGLVGLVGHLGSD